MAPTIRPQRPRKDVSRTKLTLLSPFFRYSLSRDAYVLRGIGQRHGPVLREEVLQPASETPPADATAASPPTAARSR